MDTHAILDLIPQRPPVVCVDKLLEVSLEETRSAFMIPKDFIFQKNGFVTTAGLLENIAQTAAARAGYFARENKEEVRLGFIVAFKNVQSGNLPPTGTQINTKVTFMQSILNMSIFYGEVYLHDNLLLSCEIRILVDDKK